MKDLVQVFREKMSRYTLPELDAKLGRYAIYEEVGPSVEDYLFGIGGAFENVIQVEMSCNQDQDFYAGYCHYDMAA